MWSIRTIRTYCLKVDPNACFGLHTKYGWFSIARKYYAADWTLDGVHSLIDKTYPDISTNPRSRSEIQLVIDLWCDQVSMRLKPKPTKLTRAHKEELDLLLLYKLQTKDSQKRRSKKTLDKREEKKLLKKQQKLQRQQKKAETIQYVKEHGVFPSDYDFLSVSLTNAWNHYAAKNHTKGLSTDLKSVCSEKWNQLAVEEKEACRQEYIDLLKKGVAYEKGELIPLKKKFAKVKG